MTQPYGLLRIVRVRPPSDAYVEQKRYPTTGWLPEDGAVRLLTQTDVSIGRGSSSTITLSDPTVSRLHARLVLYKDGWYLINITTRNIVSVNGRPVASGMAVPLQGQDYFVLGSTLLQLVIPQALDHQPEPTGAAGIVLERQNTVRPPAAIVLPTQPEPERQALFWDTMQSMELLGPNVTMQFALPVRMNKRLRWLITGIALAIFLMSMIATIVISSITGATVLHRNGLSSIMIALTIPLLPVIGVLVLVGFIDRYEVEPWFLRLGAFLWGAFIAIPLSFFAERSILSSLQVLLGNNTTLFALAQGLTAGVIEETCKGLGLLILFFFIHDEFDNITDGIVYSLLIGAGFALVENFSFFAVNAQQFLLNLIIGRLVFGWLNHSTFTACFGIALGYVRHTTQRRRQIVTVLLGYLLALGLHGLFDFVLYFANTIALATPQSASATTLAQFLIIGDYIPPFLSQLGILFILIRSLAHERVVIREFLAIEVRNGIVSMNEYALLQDAATRRSEERHVLWHSGIRQWRYIRALYQAEIGLAFRKWHVSMGDRAKNGPRQPEEVYRKRIRHLRRAAGLSL